MKKIVEIELTEEQEKHFREGLEKHEFLKEIQAAIKDGRFELDVPGIPCKFYAEGSNEGIGIKIGFECEF